MNKMLPQHNNRTVITGLQYFVSCNYYNLLFTATNILFDVFEMHEKRSFSNRCEIAGANGKIILTVPLIGGRNQRLFMKDILISNEEKWQLRHWRSILSSYNSSPWFEHYRDELAEIYMRPFTYLKDWNLVCMEWIFDKLKLQPVIRFTSEAFPATSITGDIIDLRKKATAKKLSQQERKPLVYQQVFQDKLGFMPDLSILDLLFCEGPTRTLELLQQEEAGGSM